IRHATAATYTLSLHDALPILGEEAVQLHAAVLRPGEAAAAEDADGQPEVAAVLLRHQVGRRLGGPEQAVQRLVDAAALVDAVPVLGAGIVVALRQLAQRQLD